MDENNWYLRASFKDLESISIETPSTKILEQLSKTGFQIRIISKDKKEVLSLIQSVNEGGISVQNESDPNPVLIPKEEIASVFYRANEKKAEPPPNEKEIQPITILDYLIPGYYIKNQGYTKSGYTLMGAAAFFLPGTIYICFCDSVAILITLYTSGWSIYKIRSSQKSNVFFQLPLHNTRNYFFFDFGFNRNCNSTYKDAYVF